MARTGKKQAAPREQLNDTQSVQRTFAHLLAPGAWRAAQAIEAAERTATEPQYQVQEFAKTPTCIDQSGILEGIRNER
jgi:hypothetical protein